MLQRFDDALSSYDKAIALNAGVFRAWFGRGIFSPIVNLRRRTGGLRQGTRGEGLISPMAGSVAACTVGFHRFEDALSPDDKAVALAPKLSNAWLGRG